MEQQKISKRQFLKMMGGLSLGLLPLAGCFSREERRKAQSKPVRTGANIDKPEAEAQYHITDKDVIVLKRDDAAFEEYNRSYNKRIHLLPKYIAVCYTEPGVQYAVQKAKQEQLPLSIKSGGHSFEGFSSNNDGMVINLSNMKKITWNDDGSVDIQPGLLLKELQQEVYARGRLVPAGSCGGVGIGGLTLGGGYGFFSRKYGFTCDSVQDATMVTADEKVIHAAGDKDLLWALKGGGNGNFGVVTSLRFKTYPAPETFTAYTAKHFITDENAFKTILEKWMDITPDLPLEAFAAFVQNGRTLTLLFTDYGQSDIQKIVSQFSENAKSFSSSLNKPLVPALKRFYGRPDPLFFKNASCGYFNTFGDVSGIAAGIYENMIQQRGIIFQLNTVGGAVDNADFKNASCYPHRAYNFLGELQGYYDSKHEEAEILKAFSAIQSLIASNGNKAYYRNYPDIDFQNWQTAYYGENYIRLKQIKKQYDPANLFHYPQSIELSGS